MELPDFEHINGLLVQIFSVLQTVGITNEAVFTIFASYNSPDNFKKQFLHELEAFTLAEKHIEKYDETATY